MVADHIGGEHSWLYAITGGDTFFFSAAEVFVFISGLLMGIIYAGVIARQGLGAALMKSLQRAWSLYLMTMSLTLTLMVLSTQVNLGWGPGAADASWFDLIISVLTLHRTFYLTDILLLYTLLVLAAGSGARASGARQDDLRSGRLLGSVAPLAAGAPACAISLGDH